MLKLVDKGDHHVLIGRYVYDDTMFVVCHWHYVPTKEEVEEMLTTVEDTGESVEFFVT